MHGMHAITDMHRIAMLEARSARPNAPKRPDKEPRRPLLDGVRMTFTTWLRALANALEPATAQTPATVTVRASNNPCP